MDTPLSRQYLLGLKAKTDEETRMKNVQQYAQHIYQQVKQTATTTTQTHYQQQVQPDNGNPHAYGYFNTRYSMPDILDRLRSMFPDSKVEFKSLSRGVDANGVVVSNYAVVNTQFNQDFIVIDWS